MSITKHKIILNWLIVFVPLAFLMLVNQSFKKDSSQVGVTPEPDPYNVVIDCDWGGADWVPSKETVRNYAKDKYVDTIFINVANSADSYCFGPGIFHEVRDTLQTRFDIAPKKVRGMGIIYVSPVNGAQLPGYDVGGTGMALQDSIWFANKGFQICRYNLER